MINKSKNIKTKKTLFILIIVSMIIIIISLIYILSNDYFDNKLSGEKNFGVLDIGIPNSFFPENIDIVDYHKYGIEGDFTYKENAGMQGVSGIKFVYNVTQYKQEEYSKHQFSALKTSAENHLLSSSNRERYIPLNSSEFYYECGDFRSNGSMCKFIGRYGEFVISYFTTTDAGIGQVNAVVQYLDEHMGKLMKGEAVEDWRAIKGPYWKEWEVEEK